MSYLLRFYFTLIIMLTSTLLFGQDNRVDTIWEDSKQLWYDGEFQLVIDTLKVALSIIEVGEYQDKYKQETLTAKMYRNIGMCHRRLFEYEKTEKNIGIAIGKYQYILSDTNAVKKDTSRLGVCFQHKALLMIDWGELKKALSYAIEAQQIFTEIKEVHNQVRIGNIIAGIYFDLQNFKKAENIALQSIKIYHEEEVDKTNLLSDLYTILANTYSEQQKYQKAIKNYDKALKFTTSASDSAGIYNNLGRVYTKTREFMAADSNLRQSLSIKERVHNNSEYHPFYVSTLENFGDLKAAQKDFNTALVDYQLTLINLTDNFRNEDINTNPEVTDKYYIYNKPDLLRVLDLKAQAALKSGNIDLAYDIYQVVDKWITVFYKDLSTKASKLIWIARAHAIYGNAIEVALIKNKQEKAFEYAEKAHAVLLWQSLSQQAARSLLSENEREKMDNLTVKIRQADQQFRNDEILIEVLRTLENEQQKLEQAFEDKYPQYKKRKYQSESTTVAQVQNMLDENTAFVEYYWTDKQLHIFAITEKELTVHTIAPDNLAGDIAELRNILITSNCDDCTECYNSLAHSIYKKIIPQHIHDNANIKRLVIVADKQIGTLPFSALATEMTTAENFSNYPFLVKKYSTNYLYSAGSFLQLQQKSINETSGFAGFAPIEYQNRKPLKIAGEAVDKIADTYLIPWQKATYKKEKATKQAFIEVLAKNYQILLLATHAEYRNRKGGIAFYNEMMNQVEIDQLDNIQIQRLILSACQTAEGEQNFGEGILSLGWNFAYKGVPSITMTQWSVNEKTTMDIMIDYHEALKAKTPADQALKNAQINYLNGDIYDEKKYHPYYWSAIIHTGKP